MAFKSVSSRLPHPPLIARCRAYDDAATHRMLLATLISRRRIGYADQSGGRLIQRSSCSSFSTSSTGFVGRRTRRTCDAIVIGSGVIGSACALELRKKGFTTLNVDANAAPGYGSTSSSSAVIRVFYSLPDSCAIAWEGYHAWKKWKDYLEAGPTEDLSVFHETGAACLDVPTSAMCQSYLGKVRAAMEQFKIPCEDWDAEYLQKRMPYMSLQSYYPPRRIDDERFGEENGNTITGAYFTKHAGYVNDPQLAARNLVHAAQRKGADSPLSYTPRIALMAVATSPPITTAALAFPAVAPVAHQPMPIAGAGCSGVLATSGPELGSSLGLSGALDFDPVADLFIHQSMQRRAAGEQVVRKIYEANVATGENRETQQCRGLDEGNAAEVARFEAHWADSVRAGAHPHALQRSLADYGLQSAQSPHAGWQAAVVEVASRVQQQQQQLPRQSLHDLQQVQGQHLQHSQPVQQVQRQLQMQWSHAALPAQAMVQSGPPLQRLPIAQPAQAALPAPASQPGQMVVVAKPARTSQAVQASQLALPAQPGSLGR